MVCESFVEVFLKAILRAHTRCNLFLLRLYVLLGSIYTHKETHIYTYIDIYRYMRERERDMAMWVCWWRKEESNRLFSCFFRGWGVFKAFRTCSKGVFSFVIFRHYHSTLWIIFWNYDNRYLKTYEVLLLPCNQ